MSLQKNFTTDCSNSDATNSQITIAEDGKFLSTDKSTSFFIEIKTTLTLTTITTKRKTSASLALAAVESKTHSAIRNFNAFKATKTKFCVYLLILLGVIVRTSHAIPAPISGQRSILYSTIYRGLRYQKLLQEQKSLELLTPHRHHRSAGIMSQTNGNDVGDYCKAINNASQQIKDAKIEASRTFGHVRKLLDEYTQLIQPNNSTTEFEYTWSKHELNLTHPYTKYLKRNISRHPDIKPEELHLANIEITTEKIIDEIKNILKTWQILKTFYNETMADWNATRVNKTHDLRGENLTDKEANQKFIDIYKIFENQKHHIGQNNEYNKQILEAFGISYQNESTPLEYHRQIEHREWFLMKEYLSIAKYFIALYDFLLEKCR